MSTIFLHPTRRLFYHRSSVPTRLRCFLKGRQEIRDHGNMVVFADLRKSKEIFFRVYKMPLRECLAGGKWTISLY
jgi:hypothetical protein